MAQPHPLALRKRVVAHVEDGHTHTATAERFQVSIKFVNDMMKLKKETGSLLPRHNPGNTGHGKLAPYKDWIRERHASKPDITLAQLCLELYEEFGLEVHRPAVGRVMHELGLSHKKRHCLPANNTAVM